MLVGVITLGLAVFEPVYVLRRIQQWRRDGVATWRGENGRYETHSAASTYLNAALALVVGLPLCLWAAVTLITS